MIKKFLSKYILEVVPSIVATVVGAYIVTHYINARPATDKPQAAFTSPADPVKESAKPDTSNKPAKPDAAAARAKAVADKAAAEKATAEKAAADKAEKMAADKAAAEKAERIAAEKAATEKLASEKAAAERAREAAITPNEPRRSQSAPKATAKASTAKPDAEANAAPDDKRDANDLARAAIERLRGAEQPRHAEPPRAQEAVRVIEPSRPQERTKLNSVVYSPSAPVQPPMPSSVPPSVQPLPPAVTVAPAPSETAIMAPPRPAPMAAPDRSDIQADDSLRLTPPADIPSRPLDLHGRDRTSVADDVMSAAKSVFHAVVPDQR